MNWGTSLVAQWFGLRTLTAEGPGSVPGWRAKIPCAACREANMRFAEILFCAVESLPIRTDVIVGEAKNPLLQSWLV